VSTQAHLPLAPAGTESISSRYEGAQRRYAGRQLNGARAHALTSREYEVAQLVAYGLSNREIAEELVITEKTAKNHVQRVLDKLYVSSRVKIIARAAQLGLMAPQAAGMIAGCPAAD
jgi:DNA-binding NarL/FixJ family response regulator